MGKDFRPLYTGLPTYSTRKHELCDYHKQSGVSRIDAILERITRGSAIDEAFAMQIIRKLIDRFYGHVSSRARFESMFHAHIREFGADWNKQRCREKIIEEDRLEKAREAHEFALDAAIQNRGRLCLLKRHYGESCVYCGERSYVNRNVFIRHDVCSRKCYREVALADLRGFKKTFSISVSGKNISNRQVGKFFSLFSKKSEFFQWAQCAILLGVLIREYDNKFGTKNKPHERGAS